MAQFIFKEYMFLRPYEIIGWTETNKSKISDTAQS